MKLFVKFFSVLVIGASISSAVNANTVTIPCDSQSKNKECATDCPTTCANEMTPCEEKSPCCQMPMKTDETSPDDAAPTSLNSSNAACTLVKKIAPLCFAIGFLLAYHKLSQVDEKIDTKSTAKTTTGTDTAATEKSAETTKTVVKAISSCYSKTVEDIIKAIVAVFATDVIKDFLKEVKKTGTDFIADNTSFAC